MNTEDKFVELFLSNPLSIITDMSEKSVRKHLMCCKVSVFNKPSTYYAISFDEMSEEDRNEIKKYVIETLINRRYVINLTDKEFVKTNFALIKSSLKDKPDITLNNLLRELKNKEIYDYVIECLLENHYVINKDTPSIIKDNIKLMWSSFNTNSESIKYMNLNLDPKLLDFAIKSGYYTYENIQYDNLNVLFNKDIANIILNKSKYGKGINNIIESFINNNYNVELFKKLGYIYGSNLWEVRKEENLNLYTNVFLSLVYKLEKNKNINDIYNLQYINEMFKVIGKENVLKVCKDYLNSINTDKQQTYLDELSRICSLYISLSKDNFIKQKQNEFLSKIKDYFELNEDLKEVQKLLYEKAKIKVFSEKFRKAFELGYNDEYVNYIFSLDDDKSLIRKIVDNILFDKKIDLEEPLNYKDYLLSLKVDKIIKRLHLGNINENSMEYITFSKYIKKENDMYINTINFTKEELISIEKYIKKLELKNKISKLLIKEINNVKLMESDIEFNKKENSNNIPFEDKYFKFNPKLLLNIGNNDFFYIIRFINSMNFNNNELESINKLIIESGLLLSVLDGNLFNKKEEIKNQVYSLKDIEDLIRSYKQLIQFFGIDFMKVFNLNKIMKLKDIIGKIDIRYIYILGIENVRKILTNSNYIFRDTADSIKLEKIINIYDKAIKRDLYTVPRVKGKVGDYTYEVMDRYDVDQFTLGIDTNACFKIEGIDNDFLCYTLLNKNGFNIAIKGPDGNLVGRASGYRQGNGIYINQLRSIYDEKDVLVNEYIVDILRNVFKECCDHIIEEMNKHNDYVDFIVTTTSCIYNRCNPEYYGYKYERGLKTPFDVESDDYLEFIKEDCLKDQDRYFSKEDYVKLPTYKKDKLSDLDHKSVFKRKCFKTDIDTSYHRFIVISSNKSINTTFSDKSMDFYDAVPLYKRVRNEVIDTILNDDIIDYINRINALYSKLNNTEFNIIEPNDKLRCMYGDGFYIIYDDEDIVTCCCLDNKESLLEFKESLDKIQKKYKRI